MEPLSCQAKFSAPDRMLTNLWAGRAALLSCVLTLKGSPRTQRVFCLTVKDVLSWFQQRCAVSFPSHTSFFLSTVLLTKLLLHLPVHSGHISTYLSFNKRAVFSQFHSFLPDSNSKCDFLHLEGSCLLLLLIASSLTRKKEKQIHLLSSGSSDLAS